MSTNRLDELLGVNEQGCDPNDPWPHEDPVPLGYRAEPLPVDALGPVLGPLVEAVRDAYQVPADLPINLSLPLITTAVRGRRIVRINRDWSEVLALASLSALASGERKSPVLRLLDAPIRAHERAAQFHAEPRRAVQAGQRKVAEERADALRKKAVRASSPEEATEAEQGYLRAVSELETLRVDPMPRLLVDDITPESLDLKLHEHGAIGAISSEPGLFSILAGRYSGSANVENVLKATSGDSYTVDRVSRDEVLRIDRPALSIAMCIQPDRLRELSATAVFRAAGLLARLLFVVPEPRVGTRVVRPGLVPPHLVSTWGEHITKLAEADGTEELRLDSRAEELLHAFRAELEPQLHPHHGQLAAIADWGSKLPGAIVRIAGALELLTDARAPAINPTTMNDAIRLGRAYTTHAQRAFSVIHARDDHQARASEVLGWLQRHAAGMHTQNARGADGGSGDIGYGSGQFKLRDAWAGLRGRGWVGTAEDIRAALTVLAERGHVRKLANPPGPGRPSERYQLHPTHLVYTAGTPTHTQNPQNRGSNGGFGDFGYGSGHGDNAPGAGGLGRPTATGPSLAREAGDPLSSIAAATHDEPTPLSQPRSADAGNHTQNPQNQAPNGGFGDFGYGSRHGDNAPSGTTAPRPPLLPRKPPELDPAPRAMSYADQARAARDTEPDPFA